MKFLKNALKTILVLGVIAGVLYGVYAFVLPDSFITRIKDTISIVKEDMGYYEDSGITGEDYVNDDTFYPYYTHLGDNAKKLYQQVYANAAALETTFVPIVKISIPEVSNVINAVYHDHPELFWMECGYSYKYTSEEECLQITLSFNETINNIEKSKELFEANANEIITVAAQLGSDYEKEKYVYQAIIDLVEYDESAEVHQSPYSALVYGESVCAGYSRAFQYIMIELGVPTYYCTGQAEGHAWNIIKLDGGYYNVDVSRADTKKNPDGYFNRTDEELEGSHKRSGYSVILPKCRTKKYSGMYR